MFKKLFAVIALGASVIIYTGTAQAALNDRGGGLLYDDVLNITWLQDANYAYTSSYDADGRMNWNDATAWAAGLVYGGYDDWRLASNSPVNGTSWNYGFSYNGSSDVGYNITSPNSEMAYMYYVNLGLKGYNDTSGAVPPDWGMYGNGTWGGQKDINLVKNLQSWNYWSGAEYANTTTSSWGFQTTHGNQTNLFKGGQNFAWAVRDGDVAAVPEPETYAMLLAGLGLLGFTTRRKKPFGIRLD